MSKNTEQFREEFNVLSGAGIGVLLIHTREPHRTQDVLREVAFEKQRGFRSWDIVHGWRFFPDDPKAEIVRDKIGDVYAALRRIEDLDNDGKNSWDEGFFLMHYPHWVLPKHPAFIQCLKHYVRQFAETKQRLVMLVPEGFSPPVELQNDVTLMDFPLPSPSEIKESLLSVIEAGLDEEDKREVYTTDQMTTLVGNASGMTKLEAENSFARAIISNRETWPETSFEDFNKILLECKTDVVKRSEVLELMDGASFNEVGGLDLFKDYVSKRCKAFSPEARSFGVDVPKGIMLIGPPGTGKSLGAKATAAALGVPLINFDISRVFGSLVGQSEERVRGALKQLEAMAPCVALIDEVDKGLGGAHQSGGDSGVSRRVLGTILTHMQESTSPIYWIFTANRHDSLDPALIRKGRLDEVFCVTVPNVLERLEIIKIHLRKRNHDPDKVVHLKKAVTGSKGYVSAEIESAIAEAINESFHSGEVLTGESIAAQLYNMKPISEAFKEDFDAMSQWAKNNARMTSTPDETTAILDAKIGKPRRRKLDTRSDVHN